MWWELYMIIFDSKTSELHFYQWKKHLSSLEALKNKYLVNCHELLCRNTGTQVSRKLAIPGKEATWRKPPLKREPYWITSLDTVAPLGMKKGPGTASSCKIPSETNPTSRQSPKIDFLQVTCMCCTDFSIIVWSIGYGDGLESWFLYCPYLPSPTLLPDLV